MPFDESFGGRGSGAKNVLGGPLAVCGTDPVTGFYRDGCCNTDAMDAGVHTVCAVMTRDFLTFSAARGNDLSMPRPEFGFTGLKPGDGWCLCAARWLEAYEAGSAPCVKLDACHARTLQIVPLEALQAFAV
jgi:hypothetical protein